MQLSRGQGKCLAHCRSPAARPQEAVAWQQREVRIFGKTVLQPRLIAYQADDPSMRYTYSGATLEAEPWGQAVLEIKVMSLFELTCFLFLEQAACSAGCKLEAAGSPRGDSGRQTSSRVREVDRFRNDIHVRVW